MELFLTKLSIVLAGLAIFMFVFFVRHKLGEEKYSDLLSKKSQVMQYKDLRKVSNLEVENKKKKKMYKIGGIVSLLSYITVETIA